MLQLLRFTALSSWPGRTGRWAGNVTAAALSLSNAIAAAPQTGNFLTSSPSAGVITLASKSNGAVYNFGLASSVAGITISGALMTGGSDMNYALNSKVINIAAPRASARGFRFSTRSIWRAYSPSRTGTTYLRGRGRLLTISPSRRLLPWPWPGRSLR